MYVTLYILRTVVKRTVRIFVTVYGISIKKLRARIYSISHFRRGRENWNVFRKISLNQLCYCSVLTFSTFFTSYFTIFYSFCTDCAHHCYLINLFHWLHSYYQAILYIHFPNFMSSFGPKRERKKGRDIFPASTSNYVNWRMHIWRSTGQRSMCNTSTRKF
jgi:hypothetical protein